MAKRLSEINNTATFSWSPGQQAPLLAAGTAAGALDDSFSNTSELELFKLDFKNSSQGVTSVGKIASSAR
jgi:protein transport protein SEC31